MPLGNGNSGSGAVKGWSPAAAPTDLRFTSAACRMEKNEPRWRNTATLRERAVPLGSDSACRLKSSLTQAHDAFPCALTVPWNKGCTHGPAHCGQRGLCGTQLARDKRLPHSSANPALLFSSPHTCGGRQAARGRAVLCWGFPHRMCAEGRLDRVFGSQTRPACVAREQATHQAHTSQVLQWAQTSQGGALEQCFPTFVGRPLRLEVPPEVTC